VLFGRGNVWEVCFIERKVEQTSSWGCDIVEEKQNLSGERVSAFKTKGIIWCWRESSGVKSRESHAEGTICP